MQNKEQNRLLRKLGIKLAIKCLKIKEKNYCILLDYFAVLEIIDIYNYKYLI